MHIESKRKIKAKLKILFFLFALFLTAFLACVLVFLLCNYSHSVIISPMRTVAVRGSTNGVLVAKVKAWCQQAHVSCVSIVSENDAIFIKLDHDQSVFLSTKKDLQQQLASLQVALSEFTIKGRQFKTLDFRFLQSIATF